VSAVAGQRVQRDADVPEESAPTVAGLLNRDATCASTPMPAMFTNRRRRRRRGRSPEAWPPATRRWRAPAPVDPQLARETVPEPREYASATSVNASADATSLMVPSRPRDHAPGAAPDRRSAAPPVARPFGDETSADAPACRRLARKPRARAPAPVRAPPEIGLMMMATDMALSEPYLMASLRTVLSLMSVSSTTSAEIFVTRSAAQECRLP